VRPDRREDTLVASRPVCGARRSTSISRFAQVFFIQSLLRPVRYRTAASGAKLPFAACLYRTRANPAKISMLATGLTLVAHISDVIEQLLMS
jgi:hypothetical protein